MGAVSTIVASVAFAVGAVALYRLVDHRIRRVREIFGDESKRAGRDTPGAVIDYERDPADGVFRPKN